MRVMQCITTLAKLAIFYRMSKLPSAFYQQQDVVMVARQLLGKQLTTRFNDIITAGIIVETEAYAGVTDRASHAFGGRRTPRTEIMYAPGGVAYVYLCYGIHHLFNVVTSMAGVPHAVLIRAIEPVIGIDTMLHRCGKAVLSAKLTAGPGNLSRALGIDRLHTGEHLEGEQIWIEDVGYQLAATEIVSTTRVGVHYARQDAYLPYRFYIRGNPWVSNGKGLTPLKMAKEAAMSKKE